MCSRPSKDQHRAMRYAEAASGKPAPSTQHMRRNVEPTSPQGVRPNSKDTPMNYLRTAILLAGLTALFMGVGYLIGGGSGAVIALLVAAGMNLASYWDADKLVLGMHEGHEVDQTTRPELRRPRRS